MRIEYTDDHRWCCGLLEQGGSTPRAIGGSASRDFELPEAAVDAPELRRAGAARPGGNPWSPAEERPRAGWRRTAGLLTLVFLLGAAATPVSAQTIPAEGLAAEGQGQWDEALRIYGAQLEREPGRSDLWVRVADIYARLGRSAEAIKALEAAVAAQRDRTDLYVRLSRAYASIDQPRAAHAAIRAALALEPNDPEYLQAAGELASWSGDYGAAREAFRDLLRLRPEDAKSLLALARAEAWDGATDASVATYRRYLGVQPDDRAAWLEAARAESWRGNDAGALGLLGSYRQRFGEDDAFRLELGSALTRARRAHRALAVLRPLLASGVSDYDVMWQHTLALSEYGAERRAEREFGSVRMLGPERRETGNLARQLRLAFGSVVQPSGTAYADSDGLRSYRIPLAVSLSVAPGVRLQAGYERQELSARLGSGLEGAEGGRDASLDRAWVGGELRPWAPVIFRATAGRHDSAVREEWAYTGGVTVRAGDALRLEYDREHALMTISPRAVSLGVVRDVDRVRLGWIPVVSFAVDVDASREALSDTNERWSIRAAPRFAVVRNQHLNLDAGGSVYLFAARHNLSNGYYDPSLYEAYSLTLLPYFKFSDNYGVSVFLEGGVQRDDSRERFEPGGSAVAELTLGIYRAWVLKIHGGGTVNARLESGAFRGFSGGVVLMKRF